MHVDNVAGIKRDMTDEQKLLLMRLEKQEEQKAKKGGEQPLEREPQARLYARPGDGKLDITA